MKTTDKIFYWLAVHNVPSWVVGGVGGSVIVALFAALIALFNPQWALNALIGGSISSFLSALVVSFCGRPKK